MMGTNSFTNIGAEEILEVILQYSHGSMEGYYNETSQQDLEGLL